MSDATERAAEVLRGPEGKQLYLRLVDYAQRISRRYGWRTGKVLPQGMEPDSLANDVVRKVLQGERTWDASREPSLLNALKGMVRSDIGHLFSENETHLVEPIGVVLPDGTERTADHFRSGASNPEGILLQGEQTRLEMTALDLIRQEVEGTGDLELVFLALYESDSPHDIARDTGLPIERVYSLRRELDRIAKKITVARVAREARGRRKP